MLRRIIFLSCVALVAVLATSSKAQAWGCVRVGGYHYGGYGGYHYGAVGGYHYGAAGGYRAGYGGYHYGGYGGYRAGYVRAW